MEDASPLTRPAMLGRQHSTPLPSPFKDIPVFRQTSVPSAPPARTNSDGANPPQTPRGISVGLEPTSPGSMNQEQVSNSKRSALARMRALGSIRNTRSPYEGLGLEIRLQERTSDCNLDGPALSSEELKLTMDRAIRSFNLNPKIGLKVLKDKRVTYTKGDPPQVNARRAALFLKNTKGLNKVKIGELLGKDTQILKEYMGTFDFTQYNASTLGVEAGLREVVSFFKPPGEGQVVERIFEMFAERFSGHTSPSLDKDAVHLITMLIIMVNVALHNPNMKRGGPLRTKEQFILAFMNESSLKEKVTKEEVGQLFDNISRSEIKHVDNRDDLAGNLFTDSDMCGWLDVKLFVAGTVFPRIQTRWKRRWVILSQNVLYYFNKSTDVDFEGFIPLENLRLFTENPGQSPGLSIRHLSSQSTGALGTSTKGRQLRETESAPAPLTTPGIRDSDPESTVRAPRLGLLISCSAFRTSQSSLTSSTNTGSVETKQSTSSPWSLSPSRGLHGAPIQFVLAPKDATTLVKCAKLNKVANKKGGGQLAFQQCTYVSFRSKNKDEYDRWVSTLRQSGLVRNRAAVSFFKSISAGKYWNRSSRAKLLTPSFSMRGSFSAEQDFIDEDILSPGRTASPVGAVPLPSKPSPAIPSALPNDQHTAIILA